MTQNLAMWKQEFLTTTPSHEKSARYPDLDEAAVLYEKVIQGSMSAGQVCQSGVITRIGDALQRKTKSMKLSRTATLWLQYVYIVDILQVYPCRMYWQLGIASPNCFRNAPLLGRMWAQPLHKSAWIYLQRTSNLHNEHLDVHQHSREGLHVVRSDRH